ncbi:MAG: heavy metal translocating P-type ATPase [Candidatus Limnocylindrales bacterium]
MTRNLAPLGSLATRAMLPLTVGGLVIGIAATVAGLETVAWWAWTVPAAVVGIWLTASIITDLLAREAGVDVIAVLAIVGALLFGESLAAAVIAVMLATGDWLERFAAGRAHRELSALISRAPRIVHRHEDGAIMDRPIAEVAVGDRILVKPGEVVPVDGTVTGVPAVLDEAALTGEARLATREAGDAVSSGTVNAGAPFDLLAIATAEHSTYAGIVRLVEAAQSSKAPFVRLADRYALLFVPLTLVISGLAWIVSGDPVRALAVLVVATPCPLLLAVPIAIVAGISRSARRGIIVKGGGALEAIARARVLLFDKTGTLTAGRPHLADVVTAPGWTPDQVLGLAASLEQVSPHVLAASIVGGARERGVALVLPENVVEAPGAGITGRVGGRTVLAGTPDHASGGAGLPSWARDVRRRVTLEGATSVFVAADGVLVGALVLDDPIRPETPRVIRSLRRAGVRRTVMVTGDHYGVADMVAAAIGVDAVLAERTPADKVDAVMEERADAHGILVMVGDGINDAPALAAADVGVAMGARGATASSEAADIVITVDRLDRLPEAIRIARRSRTIALQSVILGMGMSIVAMLVATTGVLPPVAGALLQEAIDVIVILNALRALGGGLEKTPRIPGWTELSARLRTEHRELAPSIARIRALADGLGSMPPLRAREELLRIRTFLIETLVPHEEQEDRDVFPLLAQAVGNDDVTAALHRTHTEIFHLIRFVDRLVVEVPEEGPGPEDLTDLRRVLYGLDAILRLHMAQEEELYVALGDEHPGAAPVVARAA